MRIALCLEYDGSPFKGWQTQPDGGTVQDELEQALSRIADERIRVTASGRTDAGVHALAQMVHFDTTAHRPLEAWVAGTNTYLPTTIAISWSGMVSSHFHARYSARARTYCYVLHNGKTRPALLEKRAGWKPAALDIAMMDKAAGCLQGTHDFSSFRASGCASKSPVRTIYHASVRRFGPLFFFEFTANAFLYRMVRNMVAALLEVGQGKQTELFIANLLDTPGAYPHLLVPACGLYFIGAEYPDTEKHVPPKPNTQNLFAQLS